MRERRAVAVRRELKIILLESRVSNSKLADKSAEQLAPYIQNKQDSGE